MSEYNFSSPSHSPIEIELSEYSAGLSSVLRLTYSDQYPGELSIKKASRPCEEFSLPSGKTNSSSTHLRPRNLRGLLSCPELWGGPTPVLGWQNPRSSAHGDQGKIRPIGIGDKNPVNPDGNKLVYL
jgi:hypothetical protein